MFRGLLFSIVPGLSPAKSFQPVPPCLKAESVSATESCFENAIEPRPHSAQKIVDLMRHILEKAYWRTSFSCRETSLSGATTCPSAFDIHAPHLHCSQ